jgi:hypothetical protein
MVTVRTRRRKPLRCLWKLFRLASREAGALGQSLGDGIRPAGIGIPRTGPAEDR